MKLQSSILTVLALSFGGMAHAQTTIIEITGATAFRSAATASIDAAFVASGQPFGAVFTNTDSANANTTINNGTYQAWRGTFPGIAGTTVIRTSWNGSVEGVRAVAVPNATNNPEFFTQASIPPATNPPTRTGVAFASANLEQAVAEMSFSDVAIGATPVTGTLSGGPVGVVVFTMVANKTWRDDSGPGGATEGATSISAQQFRSLAANGSLPLSFFTGKEAVGAQAARVYLTGRNDGSGTRTTYLAETGFGISKPVRQYVVHDRSTPTIEKILLTPKGGGFNFQNVGTPTYASTIWGSDQDGNGGYSTGGDIRTDLAKTSTSTAEWVFEDGDESGEYEAEEDFQLRAPAKVYLVSWLTTSDARTARNTPSAGAGAMILGYNGVRLDELALTSASSTLAAADKAKVANGQYTAWSYQQLYYTPGNTAAATIFTDLKGRLNNAAVIGSAGMPLSEMKVQRSVDGGNVVPGALP